MPQKLNMQRRRPSSLLLILLVSLLLIIIISYSSSSNSIIAVVAFVTCSPIISRKTATATATTKTNNVEQQRATLLLHCSSSSSFSRSDDNNNSNEQPRRHRLQQVQVAGVSVSPLGFLVILQSILMNNDDDYDYDDAAATITNDNNNNNNNQTKKMEVAFPIQLTSSSSSSCHDDDAISSSANNSIETMTNLTTILLPSLFQENNDQSSVTSPEAFTFLQLLNGVDMATPILPPDTLSEVCVWFAFLLEEQKQNKNIKLEEKDEDGGDDDSGSEEGMGEGGLLYEDELGLETKSTTLPQSQLLLDNNNNNNSNDDDDDDDDDCEEGVQYYETKYSTALNYIRGMVRTTLPQISSSSSSSRDDNDGDDDDGRRRSSSSSNNVVNYINVSNWQRARVQLPRVWLHGVRMEKMIIMMDDLEDGKDDISEEDGMATTVGRVPIKYTLECSVDDGLKRLEIPLFAIPSSYQQQQQQHHLTAPNNLQQQVEISNEILQELSHNYNSETSASFMSLALYHRYNKSGEGSSADSPKLKVEEELLNQLIQMQQQQQQQQQQQTSTKSVQYCWPTSIRSIIQANGLPMYRPLHQIKKEDQRVLERIYGSRGSSGGGGMMDDDSSNNMVDTSKKEPKKKALTLEQQALQQRLKSAWKIATQKGDSGALEKIQKAMEELEKELIIVVEEKEEEDDEDDTSSTLDLIQRAMRERDEVVRDSEQEEEVVGLVSDLEEAIRIEEETSGEDDDREEEL